MDNNKINIDQLVELISIAKNQHELILYCLELAEQYILEQDQV